MKTKVLFTLSLACIILVASCKKEPASKPEKTPGYFKLVEIKDPGDPNVLKSVSDSSSSVFNLGELKTSKEFYFLLVNGGDEPIFDITLHTNNQAFVISPNAIGVLPPHIFSTNEPGAGFIPILSLGVTHGLRLNGIGYTDLLPMGVNSSTLTITGRTIQNEDTIMLTSNFTMAATALIMDIRLFDDLNEIDLTDPWGMMSSGWEGLAWVPYFLVSNNSVMSVENTGNVPIDLYYKQGFIWSDTLTVPVSDTASFTFSANNPNPLVLVLDGHGTITDRNRIPLGTDGKGYLGIVAPTSR